MNSKRCLMMAVAACLLAASASAQEAKPRKVEVGLAFGSATFTNYSPVSLFVDAKDRYSTGSTALYAGYRTRHNDLLGLRLGVANFNTSALKLQEAASQLAIELICRQGAPLGKRLEAFFGVNLGVAAWANSFTYLDNRYSSVRWYLGAGFEVGLNYEFASGHFFGLLCGVNTLTSRFGKKPELPTGLRATDKASFEGLGLTIQYGIRF